MEIVAEASASARVLRVVEAVEERLGMNLCYTGRATTGGRLIGALQHVPDREVFAQEMSQRRSVLTTGPGRPEGSICGLSTGQRRGIVDVRLFVEGVQEDAFLELGRHLIGRQSTHYVLIDRSTGVVEIELLLKLENGTWSPAMDVALPGALAEVNLWSARTLQTLGGTEEHWTKLREAGIRCTPIDGGMEVALGDTPLSSKNLGDVRRLRLLRALFPRLGWRGV